MMSASFAKLSNKCFSLSMLIEDAGNSLDERFLDFVTGSLNTTHPLSHSSKSAIHLCDRL